MVAFRSPGNAAFFVLLMLLPSAESGENTLADAVEANNVAVVKQLLSSGADVNVVQPDGMSALHWATWHDSSELVQQLLTAGANPVAENRYGMTPLSLACQNGSGKIVGMLLKAGADANASLPGGETALMTAARTGRSRPVELLLAAGAEVDSRDWKNQTALMWAAAEGHANVIRILLGAGAERDRMLKSGFNALYFAVREGKTEAVLALLDAGADVNSAMQPERGGGKAPRKGMSPLVLAVENGHFELAAKLLEVGADPNDLRSGYSALHTITWVRKPDRGDNPEGDPAPVGSGTLSSLQLVSKLVEHGANVNLRLTRGKSGRGRLSETGATPFLMAADTADLPLMKLLLQLGADPEIPNADNSTALMAAAGLGTLAPGEEAGTEEEALAAVELLLTLGGGVNRVDNNGETAMHGAAYKNLPRMVKRLAEAGAETSIWHQKNKYGWTPLLIAQGHRPGNFKPSPTTIKAIEELLEASGVMPESGQPVQGGNNYENRGNSSQN